MKDENKQLEILKEIQEANSHRAGDVPKSGEKKEERKPKINSRETKKYFPKKKEKEELNIVERLAYGTLSDKEWDYYFHHEKRLNELYEKEILPDVNAYLIKQKEKWTSAQKAKQIYPDPEVFTSWPPESPGLIRSKDNVSTEKKS
ncbi:MAG: hypothetical protein ACI9AR_000467, partial [Flavobacteriaceae bacterium]